MASAALMVAAPLDTPALASPPPIAEASAAFGHFQKYAEAMQMIRYHSFDFTVEAESYRGISPDQVPRSTSPVLVQQLAPDGHGVHFKASFVHTAENADGTCDLQLVHITQNAHFLEGKFDETLRGRTAAHKSLVRNDKYNRSFLIKIVWFFSPQSFFDWLADVDRLSEEQALPELQSQRDYEKELAFQDLTQGKAIEVALEQVTTPDGVDAFWRRLL